MPEYFGRRCPTCDGDSLEILHWYQSRLVALSMELHERLRASTEAHERGEHGDDVEVEDV